MRRRGCHEETNEFGGGKNVFRYEEEIKSLPTMTEERLGRGESSSGELWSSAGCGMGRRNVFDHNCIIHCNINT